MIIPKTIERIINEIKKYGLEMRIDLYQDNYFDTEPTIDCANIYVGSMEDHLKIEYSSSGCGFEYLSLSFQIENNKYYFFENEERVDIFVNIFQKFEDIFSMINDFYYSQDTFAQLVEKFDKLKGEL